jgi:tRNA(Ile)-lysidine synthase
MPNPIKFQNMDLLTEFRANLASLSLPRGRALVAVSGGPDSVALLDLLQRTADVHRLELVVAHVDHGIHPNSSSIASRVAALAAGMGLACHTETLTLGPAASETVAREARYAALFRLAARENAAGLFTAHHADDQVETVLMRVLAGSGPAGLAGMPTTAGLVIRPLLPFRRAALARYARERGLQIWDDPANGDPAHLRSWLRGEVLPLLRQRLPEVERQLHRLGAQAARDRKAWDQVLEALPGLDPRAERDGISVAATPLLAYDSALAETVLLAVARRAGCAAGPSRARRVLRLLRDGVSGQELPLGQGWRAEVSFDRLRLMRTKALRAGAPLPLDGPEGEGVWAGWRIRWRPDIAPERQERSGLTAWFLPGPLTVRSWAPGDRVRPLAGAGRRLVVRCFQEARVPRRSRESWPVLAEHESVVWIPGVCRSDALLPSPGAEALRVDAEHA